MNEPILIAGENAWIEILEGRKKITIREGYRNYREGFVLLCCPNLGYCVAADITEVRKCLLEEITQQELQDDGYESHQQMIEDMKQFGRKYESLNMKSPMTVTRWNNVRGGLLEQYLKNRSE